MSTAVNLLFFLVFLLQHLQFLIFHNLQKLVYFIILYWLQLFWCVVGRKTFSEVIFSPLISTFVFWGMCRTSFHQKILLESRTSHTQFWNSICFFILTCIISVYRSYLLPCPAVFRLKSLVMDLDSIGELLVSEEYLVNVFMKIWI